MEFLSSINWAVLGKIIGIDILLGGDNAILIAMAVAALPLAMQKRAIAYGTAGAVLARCLFLAIGFLLLLIPGIRLLGGLFLVYVGYDLLVDDGENDEHEPKSAFWAAVRTIVIADLVMSFDNVVGVIGAASGETTSHISYELFGVVASIPVPALWYTIAGIAISIPIIVYASTLIVGLMEKFSLIKWFGGALLGWIGLEMAITEPFVVARFPDIHSYGYFWAAVGATLVLVAAGYKKLKT